MNNILRSTAVKSVKYLKRNSSTFLTAISSFGVIATVILAIKETPKAMHLVQEAEESKGTKLTNKEIIQTCWKCYMPAISTGVSTILCIAGSNVISNKNRAALISAYDLANRSYNQYKDKLKEIYGEEAHEKIIDSIVKEKSKNVKISSECMWSTNSLNVEEDESAIRLFYDYLSDRYFESTLAKVIEAEYHLNRNFQISGCISINDWYDLLGLCHNDSLEYVSWNADNMYQSGMVPWIEFSHREVVLDDGLVCCIIDIPYGPDNCVLEEI